MENEHTHNSLDYLPLFLSKENYILHYTCNSPKQKVLDKHKILTMGNKFGCTEDREVLKIPLEVYKKAGFSNLYEKNVLKLNLEKLMREIK